MSATLNRDSTIAIIERGFSFRWSGDLLQEGQPVNLTGSTVTARLVSPDGLIAYGATADVLSTTPGSDWTRGLVVVVLPPETTSEAQEGEVHLLIVQEDAGENRWPWRKSLVVRQGEPASV